MKRINLFYSVNERDYFYEVQSSSFRRGKDEVLFLSDETVFKSSELLHNGIIIKEFPKHLYSSIKHNIINLIKDFLHKHNIDTSSFELERYHKIVSPDIHKKFISLFRRNIFGVGGQHLNILGIDINELNKFINDSVEGENLTCIPSYNIFGYKFYDPTFSLRIIRPNIPDNNPPHRDSHLKRLRKCVNIYLPLAGSNEKSSLSLIPKSHLESESEIVVSAPRCKVGNRNFNVPCIVRRNNGINLTTPNPSLGQIMIFSPHIIHGGAANANSDLTRVSLELRFFKNDC